MCSWQKNKCLQWNTFFNLYSKKSRRARNCWTKYELKFTTAKVSQHYPKQSFLSYRILKFTFTVAYILRSLAYQMKFLIYIRFVSYSTIFICKREIIISFYSENLILNIKGYFHIKLIKVKCSVWENVLYIHV